MGWEPDTVENIVLRRPQELFIDLKAVFKSFGGDPINVRYQHGTSAQIPGVIYKQKETDQNRVRRT